MLDFYSAYVDYVAVFSELTARKGNPAQSRLFFARFRFRNDPTPEKKFITVDSCGVDSGVASAVLEEELRYLVKCHQ